jgi:hypothetical protein
MRIIGWTRSPGIRCRYQRLRCIPISGGGDSDKSDPQAYIDYNEATPLIKFRAVGGGYPADCTAVLNIAGSYEV